MKTLALAFGVASLIFAANDTVTITSVPPGATVELNRRVIGLTPVTVTLGEYAFNPHKSSVFSKHLDQPVNLHISLDGFSSKDVDISKPLTWTSHDHKNHYTYYIIERQEFNFKLDKVSAAPKTLTNSDILELSKAGFTDEVILEKINNTATSFQLEITDMVALRKAGVSDPVIRAMMQKGSSQ